MSLLVWVKVNLVYGKYGCISHHLYVVLGGQQRGELVSDFICKARDGLAFKFRILTTLFYSK